MKPFLWLYYIENQFSTDLKSVKPKFNFIWKFEMDMVHMVEKNP